jgi:capsular exopolysaccharide synthesis family protein
MNITEVKNNKKEFFDLKQEIFKFLPFWYLFVIGVIISLVSANLYLRYQNNIYQSHTVIKLLDDANSDFKMPSSGVSFFFRNKINIDNEKEIIKSNRLLERVVQELQLYNQFFKEGNIAVIEAYGPQVPVIKWIGESKEVNSFSGSWQITYNSSGYIWNNKKRKYYQIYDIDGIAMQVIAPVQSKNFSSTLTVRKSSLISAVASLKGRISISSVSKDSELLQITTSGTLIDKNNEILDKLTDVFDRDGREDRERIFKKTVDFVNNRFEYLFKELDTIELNKANYKSNQKISFIEADSGILLSTKSVTSSEYEQAKTQSVLSDIIIIALKEVDANELLPTNIGLEEMQINDLVKQYNDVVLEAQKVITNGGKNHPRVEKLTNVQKNLKNNIKFSLKAYQKILDAKIQAIDKIKGKQENQYAALPYQEKTIRAIERQQKIKETLYLLLLQKREEASINLAITNPSVKIVDPAIASNSPLSPKRSVILLGAFVLGISIPFGLIFIYYLFDTKIHRKETIEAELEDITVLSEIPCIVKDAIIINKNDRSTLSEAFRILVANLNFIVPLKIKSNPVIFITSTVKGEGKTFVAANLALTLSSLGKKVILVGTDLRNPQLHKTLNIEKGSKGLVDLLISSDLSYKDLTIKTKINEISLDVILSGSIPPNPTEILANGELEFLFEELKQAYDYVIVDTAPTLLVADTTIIAKYADVFLYVIRANYSDKQILPYINNLKTQNKIKNTSIIFNNVGQNEGYGRGYAYAYQYNYGYGYGYDNNTILPSRFNRMKRVLKKIIKREN